MEWEIEKEISVEVSRLLTNTPLLSMQFFRALPCSPNINLLSFSLAWAKISIRLGNHCTNALISFRVTMVHTCGHCSAVLWFAHEMSWISGTSWLYDTTSRKELQLSSQQILTVNDVFLAPQRCRNIPQRIMKPLIVTYRAFSRNIWQKRSSRGIRKRCSVQKMFFHLHRYWSELCVGNGNYRQENHRSIPAFDKALAVWI